MKFVAFERAKQGTGASRRLRNTGRAPGIVYGGDGQPQLIELDHNALFFALKKEAFHSSILEMELAGNAQKVLLRDYQMHPVRNQIMHIDFQRVSATEKIHVKAPLHFINADEGPGVKLGGGIVTHILTEAEISCLAKDLPEFIEVDLGAMEVGQTVHLSEVKLPKGVEFVQLAHGNDAAVASVTKPRGAASSDVEADEESAEPAATPEAE